MNKKNLFIFSFFIVIFITFSTYLSVDFTNKSLIKFQNKEDMLNENSIWDSPIVLENINSTITSSSSHRNETQYDILNLSELKVPDTIAMAMSETYPFKKSRVWNSSYITEGENITSYIFLANYKNESYDFLIFYFINYTQQPSYLGEELSTIHYLTLNKDSYVVFALKTLPFKHPDNYLLQVVAVMDPYKTMPTGKYGFLDTGFFYYSPKVVVHVNEIIKGEINDQS
jgi:hypothetical protein